MKKRGEPDTIQSLQRKLERLSRELEMGKHVGQYEKIAMRRLKQIRVQIRTLRHNENNSN